MGTSEESMSNSKILLYGHPISSATWRVRAALIYKKADFEGKMIDIAAGDQQFKSEINPMGFVPAVKFPQNDAALFESLPIMELLDSLFPENPILPKDPFERARCRQIAEVVNSGMQPLQNPMMIKLTGIDEEAKKEFMNFTQNRGLKTLESLVGEKFCVGNHLTIADFAFVPQIRNLVDRWNIPIDDYPKVRALYEKLKDIDCISKAHPNNQKM